VIEDVKQKTLFFKLTIYADIKVYDEFWIILIVDIKVKI